MKGTVLVHCPEKRLLYLNAEGQTSDSLARSSSARGGERAERLGALGEAAALRVLRDAWKISPKMLRRDSPAGVPNRLVIPAIWVSRCAICPTCRRSCAPSLVPRTRSSAGGSNSKQPKASGGFL